MRRRTFKEMITYFNQTVSEMDIDRKHKMILLGMGTALLQKHDEDVAKIVRCKDCKYRDENWRRVSVRWLPCMDVRTGGNWYCGSAERGEQE